MAQIIRLTESLKKSLASCADAIGSLRSIEDSMKAEQIERAAYIAAHAILSANLTAPELACPGARRTYAVDAIAELIKGVFELDYAEMDAATIWRDHCRSTSVHSRRPSRGQKILHVRANSAVKIIP